jgi:hypothetical protein
LHLAADTFDPFDSSNFPSSQHPYAIETFGNNGSTTHGAAVTSPSNHALDDLVSTVPNAATVYAALKLTGSGDNFSGSDHYPVMADYVIVPTPVVLTSQGKNANGYFQVRLTSTPNTGFELQASTDLSSWTNINSGYTDASGVVVLLDTSAGSYPARFYRVVWPIP